MQRSWGARLALVALVAGCGRSTPGCGAPAPVPDDAASTDAGRDAGPTYPTCEVLAPVVAGTAETDALADAPARCGMPAYVWLRDPSLGSVVSRTRGQSFTSAMLNALATGASLALPRPIAHDVQIDDVVYVTQDRGRLVQSSAALAYPTDLPDRQSLPVFLMLHGTSGWRPRCGPTADVSYHALAAALAGFGFVVVAPDYLGLESGGTPYGAPLPYLVGEPTAIASLDAVRAGLRALSELRTAACGASDVVVWGGSQGGHAALWVERLAPYYARELRLRGVVAAVPASDVVGHAERCFSATTDGTEYFEAMLATAPTWYGAGSRLSEVFVAPHDVDLGATLAASCSPTIPVDPLDGILTSTLRDAAAAGTLDAVPTWGCILSESSLLDTSIPRLSTASDPGYGILFITGEGDTLLPPAIERPAYDTLCAAGVPLAYVECAGAQHADAALWTIGETLDFVEARLRGDAFTAACARPAAARCSGTPPRP